MEITSFEFEKTEVKGKNSFYMHTYAGTATAEDGTEYAMAYGMTGAPIIFNESNGKKVAFSWHDLINLAIELGINSESEK